MATHNWPVRNSRGCIRCLLACRSLGISEAKREQTCPQVVMDGVTAKFKFLYECWRLCSHIGLRKGDAEAAGGCLACWQRPAMASSHKENVSGLYLNRPQWTFIRPKKRVNRLNVFRKNAEFNGVIDDTDILQLKMLSNLRWLLLLNKKW